MTNKSFATPAIPKQHRIIPILRERAMAHNKPYIATAETQKTLNYPEKLVDNWQQKAVEKLGEIIKNNRALKVYLDSCTNCGACSDKCHYFLGTGDPNNMPVARQNLLRKIYRRYFTFAGKYFPKLVGAEELNETVLQEWYSYFHQCSQCRRCAVFCPKGIDTAEFSMAAREIMNHIGLGQKYSNNIMVKVEQTGNNLGLPIPAVINTLETLEEEIKEESGIDVRFPIDQQGAEVLLITPSADLFAEPHIDGLIGYAKMFHQAGISWTLSSHALEAGNFGLFIGDQIKMKTIALRTLSAARELKVKRIVVGECGHAWRVAYNFWPQWFGKLEFLDSRYPMPQHICEVSHELITRDALKLDPTANDHRVLTFHDSCNVARSSGMGNIPGGQFTLPREVIKAACNHFIEMSPDATHQQTFCCGGGGGLLTDELLELRVKGALPRVNALHQVVEEQGVTHMAAICAICKSQFSQVLPHYQLPRDMIVSTHQLLGDAILLGAKA